MDTGKRQSPIDIDTSKVQFDSKLNNKKLTKSLKIIYPKLMTNLVIQNTGYGWKLELPEMIAAKTGDHYYYYYYFIQYLLMFIYYFVFTGKFISVCLH